MSHLRTSESPWLLNFFSTESAKRGDASKTASGLREIGGSSGHDARERLVGLRSGMMRGGHRQFAGRGGTQCGIPCLPETELAAHEPPMSFKELRLLLLLYFSQRPFAQVMPDHSRSVPAVISPFGATVYVALRCLP